MNIIQKVISLLTQKDKKNLGYLLIFSIVISFIEVIGISIIMPFISASSNFEMIHTNEYLEYVYKFFMFDSEVDFLVLFGISLVFYYFFRSGINLYYQHLLSKFANNKYHYLAFSLLENYLGMEYKKFVNSNTAHLTKVIISEAGYMTTFITSFLMLLSEVFVAFFIYIMLLLVNVKLTLLITLILVFNGLLLTLTVSRKIKKVGIQREHYQKKFFEIINSSLGNYKHIKLKSNDKLILEEFEEASKGFVNSNITNQTLHPFPKYILEAVGFGILVSIITVYIYFVNNDISNYIGIITMYVLALYRLLPSVNKILNGYNDIMFTKRSLDVVHNELMYDFEKLSEEKIEFHKDITVKNMSFFFTEEKPILNEINLVINKGEKVAFIGASGSGKSTLVDIIMGLYQPINGSILVDNKKLTNENIKDFRKKVGYIPQSIYLFDGTIAQNISFGSRYDEQKVLSVLRQVNLLDFVNSLSEGIDTNVGDGGSKLSGGQKQRIGIARALYSDPDILVLDEATSALDTETEELVMNEIYELAKSRTLLIIAHRLSTIDKCDKIYILKDNKVILKGDT